MQNEVDELSPDRLRRQRLVIVGRLLLAGVVVAALASGLRIIGPDRDGPQFRTQPAQRGRLVTNTTATGTVEPTNEVEVGSEISGIVDRVLVKANDTVKPGDILAEFNKDVLKARLAEASATHEAAEAQLRKSEASASLKQLELERARSLVTKGFRSASELDLAVAEARQAEAEVEYARAQVGLAHAQMQTQAIMLSKATIRAPVHGVVMKRMVEPGQTFAASLQSPKLFTIAEDLKEMVLKLDIDEAEVGAVTQGKRALFSVEAYPGELFEARIDKVHFASDEDAGVVTYRAELTVDNESLRLRPGMTATAEIELEVVDNALLIPNQALRVNLRDTDAGKKNSGGLLGMLIPGADGKRGEAAANSVDPQTKNERTLWVLRDGRPVAISVEAGRSNGSITEIRSGGLQPGDAVIVGTSG